MKKLDPAVSREVGILARFMLIFSMAMQAIFLILGKWDVTVLLGNLLGAGGAMLNFLLLCRTLTASLEKKEEDAAMAAKLSYGYRNLLLVLILVLGAALPCFHLIAVILPLFVPRLSVALRTLIGGRNRREGEP